MDLLESCFPIWFYWWFMLYLLCRNFVILTKKFHVFCIPMDFLCFHFRPLTNILSNIGFMGLLSSLFTTARFWKPILTNFQFSNAEFRWLTTVLHFTHLHSLLHYPHGCLETFQFIQTLVTSLPFTYLLWHVFNLFSLPFLEFILIELSIFGSF